MVTGKPPRRSTPSTGPVTIDLDAKDINPADPVVNEADTAEPKATDNATAAADNIGPQQADATGAETVEDTTTTLPPEPASGQTQPPEEPAPARPEKPVERASIATAPLVAAGIFGGLVALALAGSMQYAGYLPSAEQTTTQEPQIAALTAEIDGLKQQLANIPVAPSGGDQTALEARIAALENSSAGAGQPAGVDTANLTALEEKIAALQAGLDEAKATSGNNTASLTQRLDEAERKLNEPRDDVEVARAIAAAALKATIDRGGPFLTELETLANVVPDDPSITALRPLAAAGVPSRAELLRQYPGVANTILEALHQPDPDEGVLDRLKNSALGLVKVRPVGNVVGDTPEAIVARMEDKMRNGDLDGAALEWNLLPEAGKSASTAFKQALDARISVEDLVNGAINRAVTSTGQQG